MFSICVLPASLLFYHRGSEILVKEKVQLLKTINALFLEPHRRCYVMFGFYAFLDRPTIINPIPDKMEAMS